MISHVPHYIIKYNYDSIIKRDFKKMRDKISDDWKSTRHTMLENIDRYKDIDCDGNYNMS